MPPPDSRTTERALSEHFNHAARRLRQAETLDELLSILSEVARRFAARIAVFPVTPASISKIPAFASAVETRDTIITLRDKSQLGDALDSIGPPLSQRCLLIPVLDGDSVCAILYAEDPAQPDRNALELLATLAGSKPAPSVAAGEASPSTLVQIAGIAPVQERSIPEADKPLHLKAQRYARVHVAQMLIDQYDAVEHGRRKRALYVYLKDPIESQRREFRRLYLDTCASMPDYYHEELVRTLANNAAELLGPQYPGPLR